MRASHAFGPESATSSRGVAVAWMTTVTLAMLWPLAAAAQRPPVPFDSPYAITFRASSFEMPDPEAHAVDLGEGLVAYVAEDRATDTVELTALVGASRLDDPPGREGLAEAIAFAMSAHGPMHLEPAAFRDRLSAMDGRLAASVDNEHTRLTLSVLREDLDEALRLFAALLRAPRIDTGMLEAYRRRGPVTGWNPDDPRARPEFEFPRLLYGDHPAGRRPTRESLGAITLEDASAFHARYYVPNNIVLALSGGLERASVVAGLRSASWAGASAVTPEASGGTAGAGAARGAGRPWRRATVTHAPVPPVPRVDARRIHVFPADTLQGWMVVGHLGRQGRLSDHAALEVANYILGGNGAIWKRVDAERPPAVAEGHFKARLFMESRSHRGLSNDASSYVPAGFRVPAPAYAVTLGRPESIPVLLGIIDREWRRIAEDVSDDDIEIAKAALTDGTFQMRFAGSHATALSLAEDRFFDGGHEYSRSYVARIRAVTRDQVLAAAKKHFRPQDLVAVLVGPLDAIQQSAHPQYKAKLTDFGEIVVHP